MAFKCAKEYGPSIIYIDEVEKSMPKKGAKKMEKNFVKFVENHIKKGLKWNKFKDV